MKLTRLVPLTMLLCPAILRASESDLALPAAAERSATIFSILGFSLPSMMILYIGLGVAALGMLFGWSECAKLRKLPAHKSMLDISTLIYGTCKTYLLQQGRLLLLLEVFIGATMVYYFGFLKHATPSTVVLILAWSLIGIGGSFAVAWFGMLINNIANSRMAFAALRGRALPVSEIPTRSGMSIGVLLISTELMLMIAILVFVPPALAGSCFIGFAIGESLGASVLRICGGIFTKIADIGSDLMKIVFKIKEDDARNPGVIADCAGDNAGDSVGPTADGFETYGVTGVALITFILLAVLPQYMWTFIVWIFAMRIVMIPTSILSWKINTWITKGVFGKHSHFDFEHPLTILVWLTSLMCVAVSYIVSYLMLAPHFPTLWWKLSTIEQIPGIGAEVQRDFGFTPDFEKGKLLLEDNDGAGNTFKATAKPVLIGTAVVGATTMIFSLILMLKNHFGWKDLSNLSIVDPRIILGLMMGGAVVYWFAGASRQAVTTGAYRAVDYIKRNIKLGNSDRASAEDSNAVVKICTKYAQHGMVNIFAVVFSLTLAFACFDPIFFVGYLISIAMFGLYMAINMANAGGCWDNAKKIVEVELKQKGSALHDATVIGDIVGDPFKDTSSVALNPIIKFTTLFGILAVEIAVNAPAGIAPMIGAVFFLIGIVFVLRSFYGMRISTLHPQAHIDFNEKRDADAAAAEAAASK